MEFIREGIRPYGTSTDKRNLTRFGDRSFILVTAYRQLPFAKSIHTSRQSAIYCIMEIIILLTIIFIVIMTIVSTVLLLV